MYVCNSHASSCKLSVNDSIDPFLLQSISIIHTFRKNLNKICTRCNTQALKRYCIIQNCDMKKICTKQNFYAQEHRKPQKLFLWILQSAKINRHKNVPSDKNTKINSCEKSWTIVYRFLIHMAWLKYQRTNGPVNAHLKPEIYTNKLV